MNNIINSVDPWSPLIFKSKFNGDLSHIKTKIDSIFLNKKLNNKNTVSSYEYNINALLWEEFKEFLPFLNNNINYCSSQWKYSYKQYFIQNSWFVNIHNGGYVNSHIHRGAQISIIFCIDNTEFGSDMITNIEVKSDICNVLIAPIKGNIGGIFLKEKLSVVCHEILIGPLSPVEVSLS